MKLKYLTVIISLLLYLFFSCNKSRDEPSPTQGDLEGHIFSLDSDENIKVVPNAEIDINNLSLKSDELGRFKIESITEGNYELTVTHPKHYIKTKTLNIIAGNTVNTDIILTPSPSVLVIDSEYFSDSLTLDFDSTITELTFSIKNGGGENLEWNIKENAEWLVVNDFAGTNESIIKVTVNRDQLKSLQDSTDIIITNTATNNEFIIKSKIKIDIDSQLKKGLLAYYPFNGNANDKSGNNYHGLNNGAELTTDRFNNINSSYYFDGQDVIDIPNHIKINYLNELTITCWVKPDRYKEWMSIFFKSNPKRDILFGLWRQRAYLGIGGDHVNGSGGIAISDKNDVDTTNWTLMSFTLDSLDHVNIYLNNELTTRTISSSKIAWEGRQIHIGSQQSYLNINDNIWSFIGKIDEVRVYNRVLLRDEIKYLSEH